MVAVPVIITIAVGVFAFASIDRLLDTYRKWRRDKFAWALVTGMVAAYLFIIGGSWALWWQA